jgi:methylglutaconyl-CoA hydratase
MELWRLLEALYRFPRPTIARVNGAAIGGGAGLVAACDIAIASELAVFSLSEVKLGLVPACISPFVLRKIGEGACRELFLTGERFFAKKALALGLVRELVPHDELDIAVEKKIEFLRTSGPVAVAACKDLLLKVPRLPLSEAGPLTADIIARLRVGEEGQEGLAAFLERRKPSWAE